jgi:hypothetical protein
LNLSYPDLPPNIAGAAANSNSVATALYFAMFPNGTQPTFSGAAPGTDIDIPIVPGGNTGSTAAIAQLDLVIMTDSAVAHLACAIGKPVWVLLGHVAHWLWLQGAPTAPGIRR